MNKPAKKGVARNTMVVIAILVGVVAFFAGYSTTQTMTRGLSLGEAQLSLLKAGSEAHKIGSYLDEAARLSAEESTENFYENGGFLKDNEEKDYPCGSLMSYPYWKTPHEECLPDFEGNLLHYFKTSLTPKLSAHPVYMYPYDFVLVASPKDEETSIYGQSQMTIPFIAGANNYQAQKIYLEADYPQAEMPVLLNYGERGSYEVENIVLHYTVTASAEQAIRALQEQGFSYHYIIDHDGSIIQLVPEDKSAYHAGCEGEKCLMPNMNRKSIGISFVNYGYDQRLHRLSGAACFTTGDELCWEPYTRAQMQSASELITYLALRYERLRKGEFISEENILYHSQINNEKSDPGPALDKNNLVQSINAQMRGQTNTQIAGGGTLTGAVITESIKAQVHDYDSIIEKYAQQRGLDPAIVRALITHESEGKARATSPANALGLMQIVPYSKTTGKEINHGVCVRECGYSRAENYEEVNKEEYYTPDKNICCGTAIFKEKMNHDPLTWSCCPDSSKTDNCVLNAVYDLPYEIGSRYYNGNACANWVDADYVETIMELYAEYGGNLAHTAGTTGVYRGNYRFPISFEVTSTVNLEELNNYVAFATTAVETCVDRNKECAQALAQEKAEWSEITTGCHQNALAEEFMINYLGCLELNEGDVCSFTLEEEHEKEFSLLFKSNTIHYKEKGLAPPYETYYQGEPSNLYNRIGEVTQRDFDILFDSPNQAVEAESQDQSVLAVRPLSEYTFYFLRKEEGLVFLTYHEVRGRQDYQEETQPPKISKRLFCTENNLTFALAFEERTPPAVQDLRYSYNQLLNTYLVQWPPVLYYEDNKAVSDIASYEVHCSREAEFEPNQDTRLLSISREEGYFPYDLYQNVPWMGVSFNLCQGEEVPSTQDLSDYIDPVTGLLINDVLLQKELSIHVQVLAKDPYGSYLASPELTLFPSPTAFYESSNSQENNEIISYS